MSGLLVIDDRPAQRDLLLALAASVAAEAGVEGYAEPRVALESAREFSPDLVIVGHTSPAREGLRAIPAFRELAECADVPIIVVADASDRRICGQALEAGATEIIPDPPDPRDFALRAGRLIAAHREARALRKRVAALEAEHAAVEQRYRRDLRNMRNDLRGITDTVPAMVSVADRAGQYVFMNAYMAAFYGHRAEDVIGRPVDEVIGPAQGERERAANDEVFRGAGTLAGYEEEIVDRNGVARTFLSTKSALRDENRRVVNVVTVSQDITFRKWVEAELREAKNAAESASRVKTEFLANVSHELRTPLNAIIGFADGILDDLFGAPDLDRYREYAGHISQSARHLKAIIDDILDIASIDAGRLDVETVETDLVQAVQEAVGALEDRATRAGVALHVERSADCPAVSADGDRLRQILINLVSNAVKFSSEGGEVRVEVAAVAEGVRVSVKDSGRGIDAADLPLATDRFGQLAGDPACDPVSGMGLGLPLSIGLADLMGARVEIDSDKGSGTRVDLIFPKERLIRRRLAG